MLKLCSGSHQGKFTENKLVNRGASGFKLLIATPDSQFSRDCRVISEGIYVSYKHLESQKRWTTRSDKNILTAEILSEGKR